MYNTTLVFCLGTSFTPQYMFNDRIEITSVGGLQVELILDEFYDERRCRTIMESSYVAFLGAKKIKYMGFIFTGFMIQFAEKSV